MRRGADDGGLLDLVGRVYGATEDASSWPAVLGDLAAAAGAEGAVLVARPPADGVALNISHAIDPACMRAYAVHYWREDVWVKAGASLPAGTLSTSETLLPRRQLTRTAFFNEFLHPYGLDHMSGAILENSAALWAHLSLFRCERRGPYSRDDLRLLRLVTPHVRRALHMRRLVGGALEQRRALDHVLDGLGVGVALLDPSGRLLFANRALESMVAENDGLGATSAGLACGLSGETAALRHLIADAVAMRVGSGHAAGGALAVSRRSGRRPYAVQVLPSPARDTHNPSVWAAVAGVVVVRDADRVPRPVADNLRAVYGLTEAEARLAAVLAAGRSLDAYAEQAAVTVGTARNQLKSLFVKTGTHRQAELVRLLVSA